MGYLMLKTFLFNHKISTISSITDGMKGAYTLPKGISPKVNVIAQLKFELVCYDVTIQCVYYYAIRTMKNIDKYFSW